MRLLLVVTSVMIALASSAGAQSVAVKAAKPVWGWMFGASKIVTERVPKPTGIAAGSATTSLGRTKTISERGREFASETNKAAKDKLREHNIRETGKCLATQKRLPDGTLIRHCDKPEEKPQTASKAGAKSGR